MMGRCKIFGESIFIIYLPFKNLNTVHFSIPMVSMVMADGNGNISPQLNEKICKICRKYGTFCNPK
jgi:hypothetical protein